MKGITLQGWYFTNLFYILMFVNVIRRKALVAFYEGHADAREPLETWYSVCKKAAWKSFNEVQKTYPSADIVGAGREMKLLLYLVEKYEDERYPIGLPDPIEAIRIRMEELGLTPKDLIPLIGDKGTVSKVLNRRIPLSFRMIRNLSEKLQRPADVLIREAKVVAA